MEFGVLVTICFYAFLGQSADAFYPLNSHYDANQMSLAIPMEGSSYTQFSTCFYVNLKSSIPFTEQIPILSYFAGDPETAEFIVQLEYKRQLSTLFIGGDSRAYFPLVPPTEKWTHICLTWDSDLGLVNAYSDGVSIGTATNIKTGYLFPGEGFWKTGHPQLDIGQLHFWDRVISTNEVQQALKCLLSGNILSWDSSTLENNGFAKPIISFECSSESESCLEHAVTSRLDRYDLDVKDGPYLVYGTFDKILPQQSKVSFCARLYFEEGVKLDPLGIYDEESLQIFGIFLNGNGNLGFRVGSADNHEEWTISNFQIESNKWSHCCITWSGRDGHTQLFINGELKQVKDDFMTGYRIPPGHKLWICQLQYDNADVNNPTSGFALKITDVNWWDHIIMKDEVSQLYSCSGSFNGNIINWDEDTIEFDEAWLEEVCHEHSVTSPLDKDDLHVPTNRTYKVDGFFDKMLPQQTEVSFCAWLYSESGNELDPLGVYEESLQIFGISLHRDGSLHLNIGSKGNHDERKINNLDIEYHVWDHYCITWSGKDGKTQVFVNGERLYSLRDFMTGYVLPAGNSLRVTQLQYDNIDVSNPTNGFTLKIVDINWWDYVITEDEVFQLYSCGGSLVGNILNSDEDTLELVEVCLDRPTTSVLDRDFLDETNVRHVIIGKCKEQLPELIEFSFCTWIYCANRQFQVPLSLEGFLMDFVAWNIYANGSLRLAILDQELDLDLQIEYHTWVHYCVTWSGVDGKVQAFVNGELQHDMPAFIPRPTIYEGSIICVVQLQYNNTNPNDPIDGFGLKTTGVNWWNRTISKNEVYQVYSCSGSIGGNLFSWEEDELVYAETRLD